MCVCCHTKCKCVHFFSPRDAARCGTAAIFGRHLEVSWVQMLGYSGGEGQTEADDFLAWLEYQLAWRGGPCCHSASDLRIVELDDLWPFIHSAASSDCFWSVKISPVCRLFERRPLLEEFVYPLGELFNVNPRVLEIKVIELPTNMKTTMTAAPVVCGVYTEANI